MTESAAVRALIVSKFKEGGESMMINSYSCRTALTTVSNRFSRFSALTIDISKPARLGLEGINCKYFKLVG